MFRELERLERTAIHEAGHCAVALALGIEVETVHLLPQPGGITGATRVVARVEELGADGLAMLVGGDMAEALVRAGLAAPQRPRTIPWMWSHRAAQSGHDMETRHPAHLTDGERIRGHGATVHRPPTAEEIEAAQRRAGAILHDHWAGVSGIAAQLLEHGELSGEEVAAVFRAKCGQGATGRGGSHANIPVPDVQRIAGRSRPTAPAAPARAPADGWRIMEEPGPPRRRPPGPPPRRLVRGGTMWA